MFLSKALQLSLLGRCCFSVSFCAPSPFCLVPTPQPALTAYSASKPSQKHFCNHNLSPDCVPTYLTFGVQERCIFQSIQLEKTHSENSKADSALLLECHGSAPRVSSLEPPPGSRAGIQQHHCSGREKQWIRLKNQTLPPSDEATQTTLRNDT